MPWGGHQEPPHSCHGTEDKAGASVCLPGDSPQCWGFPCSSPRLLSFSLLSAVSLLWVEHRTAGCTLTHAPHSTALYLSLREPCQAPHQGPQFCGQDRCCMFIHQRAIDHSWGFLGQTSGPSHPSSLTPNLPHKSLSLLSRFVLRVHPSVFSCKAPSSCLWTHRRLCLTDGSPQWLASTRQNPKAEIGVWVKQRRK